MGEPPAQLVGVIQAVSVRIRSEAALEAAGVSAEEIQAALDQPPLPVRSLEPVDERRRENAAVAFVGVLALYGQLFAYGYWVAAGVVEEKSSRVIEVLLATIRPKDLLAGKVIGLGLLGLGQLLLVAVLGLAAAAVTGALEIDGDLLGAVALSLVWFLLGYAFYAAAFAVAGALVPRQEELQTSTTPLTMVILVSLFAGFIVTGDPDGTLAHVCAFIPTTAPITMPSRIVLGAAPAWEIAASVAVMVGATLALIPLAARIYAAVVLRTGSAVKLREALRLASGRA
jgi:ABC-2 type transport system permease protein